jgi:hypothetical protein
LSIRELVRDEIIAREQTMVGTVVRQRKLVEFDGSVGGARCWVVDVDIGAARLVKDVPVKGGSGLRRTYADVGQTVVLRRNALGRLDIVGPGDRVMGTRKIMGYDIATGASAQQPDEGYTTQIEPYDFYQGPLYFMTPAQDVTFNQVPAANDELTRHGAGSWAADGFVAGVYIAVSGSVSNDGFYGPILSPTATVLYFAGDVFTDEGPVGGVSVGHTTRWADNATPYPVRTTRDALGNIIP